MQLTPPRIDALPPDDADRVDELCDRFEAEWKAGKRSSLEEQLRGIEGPAALVLFWELLHLEVEHRQMHGEQVDRANYLERFPTYRELVELFFSGSASRDRGISSLQSVEPIQLPWILGSGGESIEPGLSDLTPERIGPYRIQRILGKGGMGIVYLADQTQPIQRRVAVKLIKPGMDSEEVLARFKAEFQILALMRHHGIASVYDAGISEGGRPYFVMEYVPGKPITKYCDGQRLNIRERLGLFLQVCEAVQHAHQKAIIHRDIKPSNVLVMSQNGKAALKVIDFGVAKAMKQRLTDETIFTKLGQVLGTPEYMSPEQVGPDLLDIDTRTDVYSLGVLLYEMLVGSLPFERESLRAAGHAEIQRIIREVEPPRPSTKLSKVDSASSVAAARRRTDAKALQREVCGDLDWITMKAIEKDRIRRYGSASGLSSDVSRYLAHEPVVASPPSAAYRAKKLLRKYRGPVAATLALIGVLVAGLVSSAIFYVRVKRIAGDLKIQRDEKAAALIEKDEAFARSEGLRLVAHSIAVLPSDPGLALCLALKGAERHQPRAASETILAALEALHEHRTLVGHNSTILTASFSPDGTKALTAQAARGNMPARLWDVRSGEPIALLYSDPPIQWATFSPDGHLILTAGTQGIAELWEAASGRRTFRFQSNMHSPGPESFSPDGSSLVLCRDDEAEIRATGSGEILYTLQGHQSGIRFAAFSPDGRTIVTTSADQTARIWDAKTGSFRYSLNWLEGKLQRYVLSSDGKPLSAEINSSEFSPDGRSLLTFDTEDPARLWDVDTGKEIDVLPYVSRYPGFARFSPDGKRILTFSSGDEFAFIEVREIETKQRIATLKGHNKSITSATFSPNGDLIASGSYDGTVRIWHAGTGQELAVMRGHTDAVRTVAFSSDGALVISGSTDTTARVWHVTSEKERASLGFGLGESHPWPWIAYTQDGTRFVAPSGDGLAIWDAETGKVSTILDFPGVSNDLKITKRVGFSPDGKWFLMGSQLLAAKTGESIALAEHAGEVTAASFSADSSKWATGNARGSVSVWSVPSGKKLLSLTAHEGEIAAVRFRVDGKRLLTAASGWIASEDNRSLRRTEDRTARIWDAESGLLLVEMPHAEGLSEALWSPNGDVVFTISGKIRVWDADSGRLLRTPESQPGVLAGGMLSADGERFLGYDREGIVRVWDIDEWKQIIKIEVGERLSSATLTPDGQRIATASEREIRTWPVDPISAGTSLKPRDLTPEETIEYEIGTEQTRLDYSQAWHVGVFCREARLARQFLQLHPQNEGMIDYFARIVRDLVTRLAEGGAAAVAAEAFDCVSWATAVHQESDPELSATLAELEALSKEYDTEVRLCHEVATIVDKHFDEKLWTESVISTLERDDTLDARHRLAAIRMARGRKKPTAEDLNGRSWSVVSVAERSHEAYQRALRLAEEASRAAPNDGAILNTLGVAQYRNGLYSLAFATLTRSNELNQNSRHGSVADLLFMAMSQFQLGHHEEAKRLVEEARKVPDRRNLETDDFFREADALLSSQ